MSALFPTLGKSARFSECGKYRYTLARQWTCGKTVAFLMLNPSTADEWEDDPTIRRCIGFAQSWGFSGIVVVNLFALRATDPAELRKHPHPIAPPDEHAPFHENANDAWIVAASDGMPLIAAWGTHGTLYGRDHRVMELLKSRRVECLGITKDGHPRHPLYIARSVQRVPFSLPTPRRDVKGGGAE